MADIWTMSLPEFASYLASGGAEETSSEDLAGFFAAMEELKAKAAGTAIQPVGLPVIPPPAPPEKKPMVPMWAWITLGLGALGTLGAGALGVGYMVFRKPKRKRGRRR